MLSSFSQNLLLPLIWFDLSGAVRISWEVQVWAYQEGAKGCGKSCLHNWVLEPLPQTQNMFISFPILLLYTISNRQYVYLYLHYFSGQQNQPSLCSNFFCLKMFVLWDQHERTAISIGLFWSQIKWKYKLCKHHIKSSQWKTNTCNHTADEEDKT